MNIKNLGRLMTIKLFLILGLFNFNSLILYGTPSEDAEIATNNLLTAIETNDVKNFEEAIDKLDEIAQSPDGVKAVQGQLSKITEQIPDISKNKPKALNEKNQGLFKATLPTKKKRSTPIFSGQPKIESKRTNGKTFFSKKMITASSALATILAAIILKDLWLPDFTSKKEEKTSEEEIAPELEEENSEENKTVSAPLSEPLIETTSLQPTPPPKPDHIKKTTHPGPEATEAQPEKPQTTTSVNLLQKATNFFYKVIPTITL